MGKGKKKRKKEARDFGPVTTFGGFEQPLASAAALSSSFFATGNLSSSPVSLPWEERARKAMEFYLEEPLVSNAVNAWRTFALGDEITVRCEDEEIQEEARDLFYDLGLNTFVRDMVLQLLVKGDAIGYFNRTKHGDDLASVTCVNPVSVQLGFEDDVLVEAIQKPQMDQSGNVGSSEISLALDQLLHLKWNAPGFEQRGHSMVLPAFEAIELLRDYRRAERAIAKRWATPLRFIQVGGAYGGRIINPDQGMLDRVKAEIEKADLKSGLVVPFYVKAETYGVEGTSLNTESKVHETKEDIMVALGLARSLISGDGPNFATASISMQKMVVQLKEIKQAARDILDWVYDEWMERKGYDEALHYEFNDLDLTSEVDQKKLLIDLYDRGLITKKTLQQKMSLSPEVEEKGEEERHWSVQDISQLVALEVLTVDEARERLGLMKPADHAQEDAARADVERIYAKHG